MFCRYSFFFWIASFIGYFLVHASDCRLVNCSSHLDLPTHCEDIIETNCSSFSSLSSSFETKKVPSAMDMLKTARANFQSWNDALQNKNQMLVVGMYSDAQLSFLPTVSPKHITRPTDVEKYFEAFMTGNPFGTIIDDDIQIFDNGDSYLHSGMYTFEIGPDANRQAVEARFSYVWKKEGDDWKITHHHSSVRPT